MCKGLGFRVEGGGALEFIVAGFEEALKIFTFRTPRYRSSNETFKLTFLGLRAGLGFSVFGAATLHMSCSFGGYSFLECLTRGANPGEISTAETTHTASCSGLRV